MCGVFCNRDVTLELGSGPHGIQQRLKELLPDCRILCLTQIHSDRIVRAEDVAENHFPEADGIISCDPSVVLCIRTADCVPLLMWADDSPVIAAVHAGWRGLALRIVSKAVELMHAEGAGDIHVSMGPSIGPCCYAVGSEVVDALAAEASSTCDGRLSVDLHRVAELQAQDAGVRPEMIHHVHTCTCCSVESYFSYRRDGEFTGRNISVIGGRSCSLPGLPAR